MQFVTCQASDWKILFLTILSSDHHNFFSPDPQKPLTNWHDYNKPSLSFYVCTDPDLIMGYRNVTTQNGPSVYTK